MTDFIPPIGTAMNKHLIDYIDNQISAASRFVLGYMPLDVTVDQAYEELLKCSTFFISGNSEMMEAFTTACHYLPPVSCFKRVNFSLPVQYGPTVELNQIVSVQLRFNPSTKYPQFLLPAGGFTFNSESKLQDMLQTPIAVARDWQHLIHVWGAFNKNESITTPMLSHLFPWIRTVLADFQTHQLPVEVKLVERRIIDREVATIMRGDVPTMFPSMGNVSSIARSGSALFTQYRLLKSTWDQQTEMSPLGVDCTKSLIDSDLFGKLEEVITDWESDRQKWAERQFDRTIIKASKASDKL